MDGMLPHCTSHGDVSMPAKSCECMHTMKDRSHLKACCLPMAQDVDAGAPPHLQSLPPLVANPSCPVNLHEAAPAFVRPSSSPVDDDLALERWECTIASRLHCQSTARYPMHQLHQRLPQLRCRLTQFKNGICSHLSSQARMTST